MAPGIITIATGSNPIVFQSEEERALYVPKKIGEVCTYIAGGINWYLNSKKMTKKEFSERTGITKWRLKRILDGNYGGLSIKDMAAISCEFCNDRDKFIREILTEKTNNYSDKHTFK